jgi:hypothetical protein
MAPSSGLSIMLGLVVIITIVKLTSNGMRKLKHAYSTRYFPVQFTVTRMPGPQKEKSFIQ